MLLVKNSKPAVLPVAPKLRHPRRGYSLPNMLATLAIITVLGGIALVLVSQTRQSAYSAKCLSNLHSIGAAFSQYAADNDNAYPTPSQNGCSWESSLEPYLRQPMVFACPSDSEIYPAVGSSYDWRDTPDPTTSLAGRKISEPIRGDAVLAFETLPGWHARHMMNAVHVNGAAETMTDSACLADLQSPVTVWSALPTAQPLFCSGIQTMRVLVAEDHDSLARSIANGLREEGFAVDLTHDGQEALRLAKEHAYDCVVLDIMLPTMDGWTIVRHLRSSGSACPILMLTARDAVEDRVKGLNLGADDYLVKPFAWDELLARVRALVRRGHGKESSIVQVADLEIDSVAKTVSRGGKQIPLSAKEYALLELLIHRQGAVLSRSEIWDHLYDRVDEPGSNVVDVYIGYLRNKIDKDFPVKLIHTRRGMGYVLAQMD